MRVTAAAVAGGIVPTPTARKKSVGKSSARGLERVSQVEEVVGGGPIRRVQDPFEVFHRLPVELPQRGGRAGPVREVHEAPADLPEDDRMVRDPLEATGGGPETEAFRSPPSHPQLDRGEPLNVPGVPVDLIIPVFPVPVLCEREVGPAFDRLAVELDHAPSHSGDPLVERDRALKREVPQVKDSRLVRDDLGLSGPSAKSADDLAGPSRDLRALPDREFAGSGQVGAQQRRRNRCSGSSRRPTSRVAPSNSASGEVVSSLRSVGMWAVTIGATRPSFGAAVRRARETEVVPTSPELPPTGFLFFITPERPCSPYIEFQFRL